MFYHCQKQKTRRFIIMREKTQGRMIKIKIICNTTSSLKMLLEGRSESSKVIIITIDTLERVEWSSWEGTDRKEWMSLAEVRMTCASIDLIDFMETHHQTKHIQDMRKNASILYGKVYIQRRTKGESVLGNFPPVCHSSKPDFREILTQYEEKKLRISFQHACLRVRICTRIHTRSWFQTHMISCLTHIILVSDLRESFRARRHSLQLLALKRKTESMSIPIEKLHRSGITGIELAQREQIQESKVYSTLLSENLLSGYSASEALRVLSQECSKCSCCMQQVFLLHSLHAFAWREWTAIEGIGQEVSLTKKDDSAKRHGKECRSSSRERAVIC